MVSRRLFIAVSVLGLAAAYAIGASHRAPPLPDGTFDTVRAKTFELLDARGHTLLVFTAMPQGGPGVAIAWRDNLKAFASLTVAPHGEVMLEMSDLNELTTAIVSLGVHDGGTVTVRSSRHGTTAVMGVKGDGTVVVSTPTSKADNRSRSSED